MTFLNNYQTELDRARQWKAAPSSNGNGSHPSESPFAIAKRIDAANERLSSLAFKKVTRDGKTTWPDSLLPEVTDLKTKIANWKKQLIQ